MHQQKGFTVIELTVVIVVALAVATLFFIQKQGVDMASRDKQRKTSINSLHYGLEKVFYPQYHYYPNQLNKETLAVVEPGLFKDPSGQEINQPKSNYRYLPSGCIKDKCKGYTLRTTLEKEADYIKRSQGGS